MILSLPSSSHRQGTTHTVGSFHLIDHWFEVPATHGLALSLGMDAALEHPFAKQTLTIFAREVINVSPELTTSVDERPLMVYLQGGPGGKSPRLLSDQGWVQELSKTHRLVLLDQRGTGLSTAFTAQTIQQGRSIEQQVAYCELFRADSIVADAEVVRRFLCAGRKDQRWSTMGQSYGGFLTLSYLSFVPESLKDSRMTAGLAPLRASIDQVYQSTLDRVYERNEQFYQWYPEDEELARRVASFVEENEVYLPSGERLTVPRFQMLGQYLGGNSRVHGLHYLLESAFAEGTSHLSAQFLSEAEQVLSFRSSPLYALLHESIYADGPAQGGSPSPAPTNWSAARMAKKRPEFSPDASRILFTGEHIFPWLFEQDTALKPLAELADALAQKDDWGPLYSHEQLASNEVPLAAAAYTPDIYVDYAHSMSTAQWVKNTKVWTSHTHHHDGLGTDGTLILGHLKNLLADMR
ncbi:alpha/beta fold hydrolase [Rothia sp. CCM 9418]|uniref:alpha/beta fold hydrolase n=1 Tax=Rothia sp. CCM 9418 TaxID=3402661 RepID=UPI003AECAB2E